MKVQLIFHTFPLVSVDGRPVENLKAVYSPVPSVETQVERLAEGQASTSDVYGRLQCEFPGATKERMRLDLKDLFADMLHSDDFVDGLWALFERAAATAEAGE